MNFVICNKYEIMEVAESSDFLQDISFKDKADPKFGAKYVASLWANYNKMGGMLGNNLSGSGSVQYYMSLIQIMQGRQPSDDLWSSIGFGNNSELAEQGIARLDPKVLNLGPKFMNIIKSKINEIDYDIIADAIDPMSVDDKKQFEYAMKTAIAMKTFYEGYGLKMSELFPNIPPDQLPNSIEDLEINNLANYKIDDCIQLELYWQKVFSANNWQQIKEELAFDLPVIGKGIVKLELDGNNRERLKRVSPLRFLHSFSVSESFDNMEYAGDIEYLTPREFRMESNGYLTKEEQDELIKAHGSKFNQNLFNGSFYNTTNEDGQIYVPVLRFEYLAEDIDTFVEVTNSFGNKWLQKKTKGFKPMKSELPLYDNGTKTLILDSNISRYGGSWVIGSEKVYKYGLRETGKYTKLNYFVFAPNYQEGKGVSLAAQIIEPLSMINIAWNRIKDIFAKGYDGIAELNLSELADVTLTKGGEQLTYKAMIDLIFKNNIALKKGILNQYEQSSGSAIEIKPTGIGIDQYINMLSTALNQIRDITGINENSDGSTPKTNTLVGVMEASNRGTNAALGFLYHAYHQIYRKTAIGLIPYHKAFSDTDAYLREFTVGMAKRPTEVEWSELYGMVNKYASVPLGEGGLTAADEITIRNCHNLKQAQQVLINRVTKNMAQAQARELEKIKFNTEQSKEAAYAAADADMKKVETNLKAEIELKRFSHGCDMELQVLKNKGTADAKSLEVQGKVQSTIQAGSDNIIKESQRAENDRTVQAMKNEMDTYRTLMEAENHRLKLEVEKQKNNQKAEK